MYIRHYSQPPMRGEQKNFQRQPGGRESYSVHSHLSGRADDSANASQRTEASRRLGQRQPEDRVSYSVHSNCVGRADDTASASQRTE
ncbi:hypothetical protein J6590_003488 [Homalodisca vitripennis]|nr:hypothetical protein J6590_003488 [Homalodisca vitripennis]